MADHDQSEKVQRKATNAAPKASAPAPVMRSATPMQAERASAAQQINRSMKAWRDTGGGGRGGGGVKIPTGGGAPMAGGLKQSMEKKLGADLSDVNIHTGGDSAAASKDLNARAFTTGTDVHFGSGEFNPGTKEGKKLLAHELTHVVQAKRSGISRSEESESKGAEASEEEAPAGEMDGEKLEVSDPEEPAEKEADAVAEKVTEDEPEGEAKGDGAEASAEGGEAEAKGEEADEAPAPVAAKSISIAAKLKGVGLKVFRAGPPPAPGANETEAKNKATDLMTRLRSGFAGGAQASSAELATLLLAPDIPQLVRASGSVKEVNDLKQLFDSVRDSVDDVCQSDITEFRARLQGLQADAPDASNQLAALKADPKWVAWQNNPLVGARGKEPNVFVLNTQSEFPKKEAEIRKAVHDKEMLALTNPPAGGAAPPEGSGPAAAKQKELTYKRDLLKLKSQELALSGDFWHKLIDIGAGVGIDLLSEGAIDAAVTAIVVALTVKFPGIGALSAIPAFALKFAAKQAVKTVMTGIGVDTLNAGLEKMRGQRLDTRIKGVDALSDAEVDELAMMLDLAPAEVFSKLQSLGTEKEKAEKEAAAQTGQKAAEEDEKQEGIVKKLGKEAGKRALFDAAGELAKQIFLPFASIAEKLPEIGGKLADVKKVMGELKMIRAEIKAIEQSLGEMAQNPPPAT